MREIRIEKVTLNMGCGDNKDKIEKAAKLLEMLTERKPVITNSKRRSTFGVPKGKPIGVMLTLRGKKAEDFLRKAFYAVDNKLKSSQFDNEGNFSLGVKEYIDIQGVKYSHQVGMMGLDVAVALDRPGFSIKKKEDTEKKNTKKS